MVHFFIVGQEKSRNNHLLLNPFIPFFQQFIFSSHFLSFLIALVQSNFLLSHVFPGLTLKRLLWALLSFITTLQAAMSTLCFLSSIIFTLSNSIFDPFWLLHTALELFWPKSSFTCREMFFLFFLIYHISLTPLLPEPPFLLDFIASVIICISQHW